MLNVAFTVRSAPVVHPADMRLKTFVWVAAAVVILLVLVRALTHGGVLSTWLRYIPGH